MATTTALDIIYGALRILQVLSPDVSLTDNEANDALDALNLMLDGWSNEALMLTHITSETFALTINQGSYTIGAGGDFNAVRPMDVEKSTFLVNGLDYPLTMLTYDDWAEIRLKSLKSTFPQFMYIDQTYPLSTIYVYPVPNSAVSLTLYSRKEFTNFANLNTVLSFPPGYARAMKFCLAVEIAPEYQTTAGADVLNMAISAKAGIKRTNNRKITSQVDPALIQNKRGFNIYRGY